MFTGEIDEIDNDGNIKRKDISLLYKDNPTVELTVMKCEALEVLQLHFSSDCGKHGTHETLDRFDLTPKELLDILQKHEDEKA